MATRACNELVFPDMTQCPACNGSKGVQPNQHNPAGECKACGNTGLKNPTREEMAAALNIPVTDWAKVWEPRYIRVYGKLLEWHSLGMSHVRDRLRED
jgi:hypothetical protein